MSITVPIDEAQSRLAELIRQLAPGEEIIITENQQPVARLAAEKSPPRQRRVPGLGKGMITILSDDDDHLKDFEEYMP